MGLKSTFCTKGSRNEKFLAVLDRESISFGIMLWAILIEGKNSDNE